MNTTDMSDESHKTYRITDDQQLIETTHVRHLQESYLQNNDVQPILPHHVIQTGQKVLKISAQEPVNSQVNNSGQSSFLKAATQQTVSQMLSRKRKQTNSLSEMNVTSKAVSQHRNSLTLPQSKTLGNHSSVSCYPMETVTTGGSYHHTPITHTESAISGTVCSLGQVSTPDLNVIHSASVTNMTDPTERIFNIQRVGVYSNGSLKPYETVVTSKSTTKTRTSHAMDEVQNVPSKGMELEEDSVSLSEPMSQVSCNTDDFLQDSPATVGDKRGVGDAMDGVGEDTVDSAVRNVLDEVDDIDFDESNLISEQRLEGCERDLLDDGNDSECAQILYEMSKSSVATRECLPEGDDQVEKHKKTSKIHSTKPKRHTVKDAEVCFAQVGKSAKIWIQEHPLINGIHLNKGKREVKKNLVRLKRQPTAVDKGSYLRNGKINDKNRIDDYFEFTEEGLARKRSFEEGLARDEYVVNWYMWCPGHGNCRRTCGGFGKCKPDCSGSRHKQDRHNCSLMLTWKLYLSDLEKWRIQITGSHVPMDAPVTWTLPAGSKERLDEDTRDIILEYSDKVLNNSEIKQLLAQKQKFAAIRNVPSCKKISRFVNNKKKRMQMKDQDVRKTLEKDENEDTRNSTEDSDPVEQVISLQEESCNDVSVPKEVITFSEANTDSSCAPRYITIDSLGTASTVQESAESGGASSGYIVAYYDNGHLSSMFNPGPSLAQGRLQTSTEHNVPSMVTESKALDPFIVSKPEIIGQSTSSILNRPSFAVSSNSLGAFNTSDIGLITSAVSQLPVIQEAGVMSPQQVQILPQQLPQSMSGMPLIGLDSEGQPCFRNYDINSLFVACQQQQPLPQQQPPL